MIDGQAHPTCPVAHLAGNGGGRPAPHLLLPMSHHGTAGRVFGDAREERAGPL